MISLKQVIALDDCQSQIALEKVDPADPQPFANEILLNPTPEEGIQALALIHSQFVEAKQIFMVVNQQIGDALIELIFLKAIYKYCQNKKSINLVLPAYLQELFEVLLEGFRIQFISVENTKDPVQVEKAVKSFTKGKALALSFANLGIKPWIKVNADILWVNDLLAVSLGIYDLETSGQSRFAKFLNDLLSLSQKPIQSAQFEYQVLKKLKDKYTSYVDQSSSPKISIVVESSKAGKRYDLQQWGQVLNLLKQRLPKAHLSVIYSEPPVGAYGQAKIRQIFSQEVDLISGNLVELLVFLSTQDLVISNDTGLSHLVALLKNGPQLLTLLLPKMPPKFWHINPGKTVSLTPDIQKATTPYNLNEADESKKWINLIEPKEIAELALSRLSKS